MMTEYIAPAKFGDEVLDYSWTWADRLEEGETVVSVEVSVAGNPLLELENDSTSDGVTTWWLSGGGLKANRSGVVNLLATTSSVPARQIGEKVRHPVKARS
jgi:hypothetical protein